MSISWSNELELQFLEYYQAEPLIWDPKHPLYKEKNKKNEAWDRISKLMDIPVVELKKKRDSLLSSYRKYRKMIRDSMVSGVGAEEVYKPVWFAYKLIDSFLGKGHTWKKSINIVPKAEPLHFDEEVQERRQATESHPKRCRKSPPELQEAWSSVLQTFSIPNSASHEDDCDLYGKLLANKLRKLSETERLQFMHEIDGMFLRRQSIPSLNLLNPANYVPSPSPSPS